MNSQFIPVSQPMLRLAKQGFAAAILGFGLLAAAAPHADAAVFVGGCFNCGFRPHFFHPFFGPRVSFVPAPPPYYAPPPAIYAPPASAYVAPGPTVSATPVSPPYRAPNGLMCREYQSTVFVGGHSQNSYGTACLQRDGSWRIAN